MEVHPFIAALRRDRSLQRHAQFAMDEARQAWRAEPGALAVTAELEHYGAGASIADCPALEKAFTGQGEAERLMQSLSRHYCAAMAANPIGHPPFRHGFDGFSSTLLLARSGRAQLMLQAREPGTYASSAYRFSHATRFDAVLAGKASARIVRMIGDGKDKAVFEEHSQMLSGGARLSLDLASEVLAIDAVERRLVILRLVRTADKPQPTREFEAVTGSFLGQSAATIASSRQEAIIALLGRMGRTEAAPQMARTALTSSDSSLRWQALRECLALDSETGFSVLLTIAKDAEDPLAGPALALRSQLCETYPLLADFDACPCPA